MLHVRGVFRNFSRERILSFVTFFKRIFFGRVNFILSISSAKNDSRGSGSMFPRKFFEILHTAMVILVFFEQFLRKVCNIFGP